LQGSPFVAFVIVNIRDESEMIRSISVVAALLLAGCSAVPSVPTHPLAPVQSHAVRIANPASGGPFAAAFSGRIDRLSCNQLMGAHFSFSGTGTATFFGKRPKFAMERGELSGTYHFYGCSAWSGGAALSIGDPTRGTIGFSLSANTITKGCLAGAKYAVTGGTGRFVNAAGSGTVSFVCTGNTYTDRWSGTLTF